MKDEEIIALYKKRSQRAVEETQKKYQSYCGTIANRILKNPQDCEECLNDTWLKAWETIPPVIPAALSAYLAKIARNTAINMYKKKYAGKRIDDRMMISMEELKECIVGKDTVESQIEEKVVVEVLNKYLGELPSLERKIFVRRYFYMDTMKEIGLLYGMKESYVKTLLFRSRKKLKKDFEKEGIFL